MAIVSRKVKVEDRELFREKCKPYQERIKQAIATEKAVLAGIHEDESQMPYKKIQLSEDMLSIAADYMQINNLSVEMINAKNNDALNDARKIIYKSIIYLEEIVTPIVDVGYSEIEDKVGKNCRRHGGKTLLSGAQAGADDSAAGRRVRRKLKMEDVIH